MSEAVKGPKSYFPAIEAKYGQSIDHWMPALDAVQDKKHLQQVNWLKTAHGLGHGHANALVHVYRIDKQP